MAVGSLEDLSNVAVIACRLAGASVKLAVQREAATIMLSPDHWAVMGSSLWSAHLLLKSGSKKASTAASTSPGRHGGRQDYGIPAELLGQFVRVERVPRFIVLRVEIPHQVGGIIGCQMRVARTRGATLPVRLRLSYYSPFFAVAAAFVRRSLHNQG